MSEIELTPEAVARAVRLADIVDQAQAARIAAAPEDSLAFDPVTLGIDAVLGRLRRDPQSFIDENLGYLMLINDAVLYVVSGTEPTPLLIEWAPGIEVPAET